MEFKTYKRYWESYAQEYKSRQSLSTSDPSRFTGIHYRQTLEVLLRHISPERLSQSTVLDFGCGTGRLAKGVAPLCRQLICMDISALEIEASQSTLKEFRNVEYRLSKSLLIDLPDKSMDFCYTYAAIFYFAAAEEFWTTVAELDRVSKNFCLHLHGVANESPNPQKHAAEGEKFLEADFYKPRAETVAARYSGPEYLIEFHEPDVRGLEPFLYKITEE